MFIQPLIFACWRLVLGDCDHNSGSPLFRMAARLDAALLTEIRKFIDDLCFSGRSDNGASLIIWGERLDVTHLPEAPCITTGFPWGTSALAADSPDHPFEGKNCATDVYIEIKSNIWRRRTVSECPGSPQTNDIYRTIMKPAPQWFGSTWQSKLHGLKILMHTADILWTIHIRLPESPYGPVLDIQSGAHLAIVWFISIFLSVYTVFSQPDRCPLNWIIDAY